MTDDKPEVDEKREALVKKLLRMVEEDLAHWKYAFDRMKFDRKYARGIQWDGDTKKDLSDPERRYVANITLRHIQARVASIYARNPTYIWRKTRRMYSKLWDGTAQQLQMAQMAIQNGLDPDGLQMAIIQDALQADQKRAQLDKMGETLTSLYEYNIGEQIHPTKTMMKRQVKTAVTCGVGYVKQTFQRTMGLSPDTERAIADHKSQIATIERLLADLEGGDLEAHEAEAGRLQVLVAELEKTEQIILREGLALDYPSPMNIIPDKNMTYLPEFLGCGHVTEQFDMTKKQVQNVYGISLRHKETSAKTDGGSANDFVAKNTNREEDESDDTVIVWQIWDKDDNMVYTVCQGYDDFLIEPHAPLQYTERFWPWYAYAPNATDDDEDPFPPSDVHLIQAMQNEINRSGESLREHRVAARPGHVTGLNMDDEDGNKLQNRNAHDVIELQGMGPDGDIRKLLQAIPTSPIDPNLYSTNPAFTDIQRTLGTQEANLGGTSGATATESSIAESSRQSSTTSSIDELDDLLTQMARAGGQILLQEVSAETVIEIVGPGAVWPNSSRDSVAREIYLEVVAGSAGRPNQAQEVSIREKMVPLLMQVPGINVEWLAKDLLNVLDDKIVYEDAIDMGALSVMAQNGAQQATANASGGDPNAQGGEGANNAAKPPTRSSEGTQRPGQDSGGLIS